MWRDINNNGSGAELESLGLGGNESGIARRPVSARKRFLMWPGFIALVCVVIYVASLLSGGYLDYLLSIHPREAGHWWAIFTAPFVHFSLSHLLNNLIAFLILGGLVAWEGTRRFLAVFFTAVLVSGLAVWILSYSFTGGISGVIFGLFGYLVAVVRTENNPREKWVRLLVALIVVFTFGLSILSGLVPRVGVSWLGHTGGLLGGILAAVIVESREKRYA